VNAGRQAHGQFSDSMPRAPGQPFHFGTKDDHRTDNLANQDMRFAKIVIDEIVKVVREQAFGRVVLVASPEMLGELRELHDVLRHDGEVVVDEVAQDLAWLTSPQVHDHLAAMKLVDPRPRVAPPVRGARTSR
jgi:protein required for attachment to host cells